MNAMRRSATNAKQNDAEITATPYRNLPRHLTSWPEPLATNGRKGFTTPAKWVEDHGAEFNVKSTHKLRELIDNGSVPSIDLSRMGDEIGMIDIGGRSGTTEMIARDPANARPRLPRLRAVAYINTKGNVVSVPTSIDINLYDSDTTREHKAKLVVEAVCASKQGKNAPIRIAWLCDHNGSTKARHIEYRTCDGELCEPTKSEDLEHLVSNIERVELYSESDLGNDIAKRVRSLFMAGIGVASEHETAAASNSSMPISVPAYAATKPSQATYSDDKSAMLATQQFDPMAKPTANNSHIMYVSTNPLSKVITKAQEGYLAMHAGVSSNYGSFFPVGHKNGAMAPGSQVFFGVRDGDTVTIVARAPYAGLRSGTPPAGQVLIKVDNIAAVSGVSFSLSAQEMSVPALPFVIGRDTGVGGFNIPAAARQSIWNAVQKGI
jgi:hypothetical protein